MINARAVISPSSMDFVKFVHIKLYMQISTTFTSLRWLRSKNYRVESCQQTEKVWKTKIQYFGSTVWDDLCLPLTHQRLLKHLQKLVKQQQKSYFRSRSMYSFSASS